MTLNAGVQPGCPLIPSEYWSHFNQLFRTSRILKSQKLWKKINKGTEWRWNKKEYTTGGKLAIWVHCLTTARYFCPSLKAGPLEVHSNCFTSLSLGPCHVSCCCSAGTHPFKGLKLRSLLLGKRKKRVQKIKDFVGITPEVNIHSHGYNHCVEHMEKMV